jgi:hypothetical protein
VTQDRPAETDDFVLALTLAAALCVSLRFIDYAYDDAYITYRYARNIVEGHGFVYNLEHNYLGTTTPLYTLLLAVLGVVVDIPLASGLISLASLLGCIWLMEMIGRRADIRFAGPLTGVFLFVDPGIYQIFGGETLFVYLLLIPLAYLLHETGRTRWAAFVFGLAILARMDAVLFVALLYARDTVQHGRIPWIESTVLLSTMAPWLIYAQGVFGHPLPSTLWAKVAQGEAGTWARFFEGAGPYLGRLVEYRGGLRPIFGLVLALGVLRVLTRERVWLFFVVGSLLYAFVYQWLLRSSFSHWYLASIFVANAILLGAGIRALGAAPGWLAARLGRAEPRPGGRWIVRGVAGLLLASLVYLGIGQILRFQIETPRRRIYTELGRWIERNTPQSATVAYFEIGYLGYFSRRTIIDPVGLVTPGGFDSIKRGNLLWIFDLYEPDYYVHNVQMGRQILIDTPWFRTHYKPVQKFEQRGFPAGLVLYERL